MRRESYDLIVIGSGPAGEKGAVQAANFGKKVALVEGEKKSIDEWIEEIREGPRYAEVTSVDQDVKEFSGKLPDFDVKF